MSAAQSWLHPFRNAGVIGLGRGAQGLLSLGYVVLASRALGPVQFGTLTLLHALAGLAAQSLRFDSWQAVMKYGAPALQGGDHPRLQRVLTFVFGLDLATATLACLLLLTAMPVLLSFTGLPADLAGLARAYAASAVFLIVGSGPLGLLRLLDRHDLISWQVTVEPLIRGIGTLVLFFACPTLPAFLVLWLVANAVGKLALFVAARRALRERGIALPWLGIDRRCLAPEPGIWRFSLGTNLNSMFNLSDLQLGPLLVGNLLGPLEAGLYRVAQQVSNAIVKPVNKLLVPAIYTDIAHLTAAADVGARAALVRRAALLAGGVALVVFALIAAFGRPLIALLFGESFAPAHTVTVWLALAGVVGTFAFAQAPLLVSTGHLRPLVLVRVFTLVVYLAGFQLLVPRFELVGAGVTVCLHAVATAALLWLALRALKVERVTGPGADMAPRRARPRGEP